MLSPISALDSHFAPVLWCYWCYGCQSAIIYDKIFFPSSTIFEQYFITIWSPIRSFLSWRNEGSILWISMRCMRDVNAENEWKYLCVCLNGCMHVCGKQNEMKWIFFFSSKRCTSLLMLANGWKFLRNFYIL